MILHALAGWAADFEKVPPAGDGAEEGDTGSQPRRASVDEPELTI